MIILTVIGVSIFVINTVKVKKIIRLQRDKKNTYQFSIFIKYKHSQ